MSVLWLEKKVPLKCFKLIFKLYAFAPVSRLSNEVLCTIVAQATAELPSVKNGGLKQNPAFQPDLYHSSVAWFFVSPTLNSGSLAASWATSAKITSF